MDKPAGHGAPIGAGARPFAGSLAGHDLLEWIGETRSAVIYRGQRQRDGTPVVLKIARGDPPSRRDIARLRYEAELLGRFDDDRVLRSYGVLEADRGAALVLEDFGGRSLDRLRDEAGGQPMEIGAFLELAVRIADALALVHARGVIHKDIKPSNILISAARVTLADFSIASLLSEARETVGLPETIEGTYAYLSPEQTGRINRSVDRRTDLYALGVTFYELLAGQRPFRSSDPVELVHAHIARVPPPLSEVAPHVPQPLSAIVARLMAKVADARYQSARGLRLDLERCRDAWRRDEALPPITPGERDFSETLRIPERLYGREQAIAGLLSAFARARQGASELLLVAGPSGVGKSAVIREVHRPITLQRGHFIAGKCDQFNRDLPYAPLLQAIAELCRHLLSEPEESLQRWRANLLEGLGPNGQLIIDAVPSAQLVLGPQPPVLEVPPDESANRFRSVFRDLLRAVSRQRPLVIFLDDLQWCDLATLQLISFVLVDPQSANLLWLGAFRDHEVGDDHPLTHMQRALAEDDVVVRRIQLGPLTLADTTALVRESLTPSARDPEPLAATLQARTEGNPFFLRALLQALADQRLLSFSSELGGWSWNDGALAASAITDDIGAFMSARLAELSPPARAALELAACVGSRFDLRLLAAAIERPIAAVAQELWEAVGKGLVRPIGDAYKFAANADADTPTLYQFLHDRVQQAAYALLSADALERLHLRLGRIMLQQLDRGELELDEALFSITNHLNAGGARIEAPAERARLRGLNLAAGRKARLATAYASAVRYLRQGMALEPADAWRRDYATTFALHRELMEAEYLNGDTAAAESLLSPLLRSARTDLERAELHVLKVQLDITRRNFHGAIATGIAGLRLLGVKLPPAGSHARVALEFARIQRSLRGRSARSLIHHRTLEDPARIMVLRLLISMAPAAYFVDNLLGIIMAIKAARLSLRHGHTEASAFGFAAYAAAIAGGFHAYERAREFAELALELNARFQNPALDSKLDFIAGMLIYAWVKPWPEIHALLLRGYQRGLRSGDLTYACYSAVSMVHAKILDGADLEQAEVFARSVHPLTRRLDDLDRDLLVLSMIRLFRCLRGLTSAPGSYSDADFDAARELDAKLNIDATPMSCLYHPLLRMIALYHFGLLDAQREAAEHAEALLEAAFAHPQRVDFYFYDALGRASEHDRSPDTERRRLRRQVARRERALRRWAETCPHNFGPKHGIVVAELARLAGSDGDALTGYLEAAEAARAAGSAQCEAIAFELAARLGLSRGFTLAGEAYLQRARDAYTRWGALGKADHLVREFGDRISPAAVHARRPELGSTGSSATVSAALDLSAVIKASQAISSELMLDRLLERLVRILMENAGARRCFVVLVSDGRLRIEAEGAVDPERVEVLQSLPVEGCPRLPTAIVSLVARTRGEVLLHDASRKGEFVGDPYIQAHGARSILCTPVLHHGELTGVLYLDNDLAAGVFTRGRVELLGQLASQIATSLENARLIRAYSRFVPHELLQLLAKGSILDVNLGDHVQRDMTVLFADVRGFTAMSEGLTPQATFDFINGLLSALEPAIADHHGFIDKYIGDAIMALFPTSPDDAVDAAIAMLRQLEAINEARARDGLASVRVGVGVNSGSLMLGTIGGRRRMDGTVISDAVNVAARVEQLTKTYELPLLITEFTRAQLVRDHDLREIDRVVVRGRSRPVVIYEVFDADAPTLRARKREALPAFARALALHRAGDHDAAREGFLAFLARVPDDRTAQVYVERCERGEGDQQRARSSDP